jgi:predicted DNA-binding transcriptional regulator AlpA
MTTLAELNSATTTERKFLDLNGVCKFFGGDETPLDASTVYRGIKAGRFPAPVKVGSLNRWLEAECHAAREQIIAQRRCA